MTGARDVADAAVATRAPTARQTCPLAPAGYAYRCQKSPANEARNKEKEPCNLAKEPCNLAKAPCKRAEDTAIGLFYYINRPLLQAKEPVKGLKTPSTCIAPQHASTCALQ